MSKASFLNEMLNNLLKKKTLFKSFKNSVDINDNFSLEALLQKVLKARGEASSNIVSEQLFEKIENAWDKMRKKYRYKMRKNIARNTIKNF